MTNDKIKGRIIEEKGNTKKVTGMIVSNKVSEEKASSKLKKTTGKVQAEYADLKNSDKNGD